MWGISSLAENQLASKKSTMLHGVSKQVRMEKRKNTVRISMGKKNHNKRKANVTAGPGENFFAKQLDFYQMKSQRYRPC